MNLDQRAGRRNPGRDGQQQRDRRQSEPDRLELGPDYASGLLGSDQRGDIQQRRVPSGAAERNVMSLKPVPIFLSQTTGALSAPLTISGITSMSQPLPTEPDDGNYKGGFGAPIRKETPKSIPVSKPKGDYGVVTMPDGTIRTTKDNLPKFDLQEAMRIWAESHNKDTEQDFLP